MNNQSELLAILREVHGLHASLAGPLTAEQLRSDSFDPDWIVSSLLSHMGSQAEIMDLFIEASVKGEEAPGREAFDGVWDRWNEMEPEDQRNGSIIRNNAHIALLESLTPEQRDAIDVPFFGAIDGAEFLRLRLDEYAVHVWDLQVTFDSSATIHPNAVPVLLDQMGRIGERYKFGGEPFTLQVQTSDPERSYVAKFGDTVKIEEGNAPTSNVLLLPAEAFVRLVFGRLYPENTPDTLTVTGDRSLDDLRSVFVGF